MSPVLEVLSMKSSNLLENSPRNASSRVESLALVEPPSLALSGKQDRKPVIREFDWPVQHTHFLHYEANLERDIKLDV